MLAKALSRSGGYAESLPVVTEALATYRELGDGPGEAYAQRILGIAHGRVGDFAGAREPAREPSPRSSGRRVDGPALPGWGPAPRAGDLAGAAAVLGEALELDREIHNRSGEAMVLNELGAVHRLSSDVDAALTAHREALAVADQVPSPYDRALSLAGFGRCALARGRRREGAAQLRTALGILRRIDAAEAAEVAEEVAAL